jgi:divalent metal cation (Fe/Co/Zn/Cd) transporter
MLFEGAAWFFAFSEFSKDKGKWGYIEAVQRGKDPTMFVVLFEDSAAMLGLLVALAGIMLTQFTGILWFDGLASIIIGLILGSTAVWLAYETKGLLIGESANQKVVDGIKRIAGSFREIEKVNELLTMHMGPDFILVNISLKFSPGTDASAIESTIDYMEDRIRQSYPSVKRIFTEVESSYSVRRSQQL